MLIETADNKSVIITKQEYFALLIESEKLNRLEAAGVDNWEGYEYMFSGEDNNDVDLDEFKQTLKKEIFGAEDEV